MILAIRVFIAGNVTWLYQPLSVSIMFTERDCNFLLSLISWCLKPLKPSLKIRKLRKNVMSLYHYPWNLKVKLLTRLFHGQKIVKYGHAGNKIKNNLWLGSVDTFYDRRLVWDRRGRRRPWQRTCRSAWGPPRRSASSRRCRAGSG